jgi:general stress protein 26
LSNPSKIDNFEQVSIYYLDDEMRERLLNTHRECVFNWATRDGWPVGVIMSYYWANGRFWLTAGGNRHRIEAVRRDPRVSVVVTSTGTELGPGKTVTVKGRAIIHEDRETKEWFYPAFANHLNPTSPEAAKRFAEMLDSPLRVVIEVVPEKWITYDGAKMGAHAAGTIDPKVLGEPKSSDTVRFEKELQRLGLSEG